MSLLARYKLDGNARDSEGTAHGTAIDVTWAPSQLVDGGGEARLNGTTSRIDTGIQFTTETAASLPVWFRPRGGAGHLVGQHDGTNGLAIEQTETGKIRLVVGATASAEVTVYPGEYHHAVPVYDNGEATLYLDNEAVASVTATVTWPAVPVTIGARADGSALLACDVVDVREYDEALAALKVDQIVLDIDLVAFNPDHATFPTASLLAHYSMGNIAGDVLYDDYGDNNGAITDAVKHVKDGLDYILFDASSLSERVTIPVSDFAVKTISLKVIPDGTVSRWEGLVCLYGGNDADRLVLFKNVTGEKRIGFYYDGLTMKDTQDWVLGEEHHVVVTYYGGSTSLYVDNRLAGSVAGDYVNVPGVSTVYLGNYIYENEIVNSGRSLLREVRFYSTGVSAEEVEQLEELDAVASFPYLSVGDAGGLATPLRSYNPHPTPVPNPTAIPRSGRSGVQGVTTLLAPPAWFDQRDGSGGSHLSPAGVVSRPDCQGRLSGNTTDQNGQPVSRRVRCFERRTGRIVRETWSNAAGYYQFDDLDPGKRFTVVAHDYSGTYNAVIADNAQPEVPA